MTDLAQADRLAKLESLRQAGRDPYPARGVDASSIESVRGSAGVPDDPGPGVGTEVTIAGRLMGLRDFGKLIFAPIQDRTGRLQVGLKKDLLSDWWPERKFLDAGDLVAVRGKLGHTQKGEPTIWVEKVWHQAKAVAAPPEKWHGLTDVEARYRRRYVDLWASEGVRDVFVQRSRVLSSTRRFLEERGFLEVETPTLHPIAGGATARPFVTHHNALDADLYLRIAPELYLKRLIVGGLERVFEVSRNFRNEGISTRHNPEFTMLELYQAQADYRDMMELTETLIESLAQELHGTTKVTFRGTEYDLKAPFERIPYFDLFKDVNGYDLDDRTRVLAQARELLPKLDADELGFWKVAGELFDETCEERIAGPAFLMDYPIELCPLTKASPERSHVGERFELFCGGMELANAFSELNDPAEQERRFEEQVASKDPETPGEVDVDYVQALEYGMPPTGGLGIGVDRLVMVLTDQESIRDVLLFPTLRPRPAAGEETEQPGQVETGQVEPGQVDAEPSGA